MLEIKLFVDGGIRNKQMALGFIAYDMDDNYLFSDCRLCGKNGTSNISEYRALIAGLAMSMHNDVDIIHIFSDSQLMVKQITGAFKVKKEELIAHNSLVMSFLDHFLSYTIKWIPRAENQKADDLVNEVFGMKSQKTQKRGKKK